MLLCIGSPIRKKAELQYVLIKVFKCSAFFYWTWTPALIKDKYETSYIFCIIDQSDSTVFSHSVKFIFFILMIPLYSPVPSLILYTKQNLLKLWILVFTICLLLSTAIARLEIILQCHTYCSETYLISLSAKYQTGTQSAKSKWYLMFMDTLREWT